MTVRGRAGARSRRSLLRAVALASVLGGVQACAACRDAPLGTARVREIEGFPILSARIGAADVGMVLDTGSEGNLLLPGAALALGLTTLPGVTARMQGTGGARDVPTVMLAGLGVGGVTLPPIATPVTPLPGLPARQPPIAGLLGVPLLASYDIDLDVPAGRLLLYSPGQCGADLPVGLRRVTLEITAERELLLPVRINGQELVALLDTGSRATLLTAAAAARLGLRAPVSANSASGVDGQRLPVEHVRVREMTVGQELRRDVPVSIAPLQLGRADMLLGLDYLGQRRIWLSYASGVLGIGAPAPGASAR